MPLFAAFIILTVIKVCTSEADNVLLILSGIMSPLAKRLAIIVGLFLDPKSNALARLVHPYPSGSGAAVEAKRKQE